MINTTQNAENP